MTKGLSVLGLLLAMLILALPAAEAKEAKYVGVKSCGKCHKKDKQGKQLAIWQKSKHAEAFKALGTADAREDAKRMGVAGDPQKAEACLACHTTGFGAPAASFARRFKVEQGVQCEACHGAGSLYRKKKVMKKIWKERGKDRKGASATAKKTGLILPDEKTCTRCHAESVTVSGKTYKNPNFKAFDFKKMAGKIEHPVPQ